MHLRTTLPSAVLLAGALLVLPPAPPAGAGETCEAAPLAQTLHERMKSDGRTDAEISDILDSSFKRGILRGRVIDGSGCSAEQVEDALRELEVATKS